MFFVWGAYVYAKHNIIKNGMKCFYKNFINIKFLSNIDIPLQENTKYTPNGRKFVILKSKQFLNMSCNAMDSQILGGH